MFFTLLIKLIFKNGEFNWSETQEGIILGSFFYGYIVSQLPGGYLAGR